MRASCWATCDSRSSSREIIWSEGLPKGFFLVYKEHMLLHDEWDVSLINLDLDNDINSDIIINNE